MFYEIARMTTKQAIEIGNRLSEQRRENEIIYIDGSNDTYVESDVANFFNNLAHYINETGMLGTTVSPEDLRIREAIGSSDLIIEANLEPAEAEIVNNMIEDKRSENERENMEVQTL